MCVVSMILDHGRDRWPPQQFPVWPQLPTMPPTRDPRAEQERRAILDFMELVQAAKRFDAAAGEPDCEDPKKAEFLVTLAARLTAIEERLGLSEPAQPKTHAGERARKRVGANQGANQ